MCPIKWQPLTSDPDLMNELIKKLGLQESYELTEVVSLDDDVLSSISGTPEALLLSSPLSSNLANSSKLKDYKEIVYYMEETCANVSGIIACIHAVSNTLGLLELEPGSILSEFVFDTVLLSPKERGGKLENNSEICGELDSVLSGLSVSEPVASPPSKKMKIEKSKKRSPSKKAEENEYNFADSSEKQQAGELDHHFSVIVNVDHKLVELDGVKQGPVFHGRTSKGRFLRDAARVCKEYMERSPDNSNFNVLAFGTQ